MVENKKVLITGASGMLGRAIVSRLSEKYNVSGLDLKKDKNILALDITDKESILQNIKRINPDIVIHTAAYTDVDGCEENIDKAFDINANGTRNVALGCMEEGSLLIYMSTDFVFDGEKQTPYTEEDIPNPINVYGRSKLEGEKIIRGLLGRFIIIRTSWLFGKRGSSFVDAILKKAKREKKIKVVKDQVGSPTYTEDLTVAIIKLAELTIDKPSSAIYHITNSGSTSWSNYAEQILKYAGIADIKVVPITSEELGRPAKRPKMSKLDNSLYQKTTGHKMRDYKEALREYILSEARTYGAKSP